MSELSQMRTIADLSIVEAAVQATNYSVLLPPAFGAGSRRNVPAPLYSRAPLQASKVVSPTLLLYPRRHGTPLVSSA